MKFLKIFLFIIVVLIALVVVLGLIGPKTYDVSRSIVIEAPAEAVYPHVSSLKAFAAWDPWARHDPTVKMTYHGTDGEPGAYSRWEGESNGVGERQLEVLIPNERVETEIRFLEPEFMAGVSTGYTDLKPTEGGTEVTWGFKGENGFIFRAMSMLPMMDMETAVGGDFEYGLDQLKAIVEQEYEASKAEMESLGVVIIDVPDRLYLTKREEISMDAMPAFFGQHYPGLAMAMGAGGISPSGAASAIYYTWNEETGMTDLAAAMPMSDEFEIQGYQNTVIPGGKYAVMKMEGGYAGLKDAHMGMDEFLAAKGITSEGPMVEEYVIGPEQDPDSNAWVTKIYYPVP